MTDTYTIMQNSKKPCPVCGSTDGYTAPRCEHMLRAVFASGYIDRVLMCSCKRCGAQVTDKFFLPEQETDKQSAVIWVITLLLILLAVIAMITT